MYRIKPWEDLTIQDDYMFKLIMGVKRICLNLLQGILRVEIKDIHYLETEKSMDARYQGKGVRMDVYVYCTQGCGNAERRDGVKPWQSTVPMKMIPGKANPFSCTDPEAGNCRCV